MSHYIKEIKVNLALKMANAILRGDTSNSTSFVRSIKFEIIQLFFL